MVLRMLSFTLDFCSDFCNELRAACAADLAVKLYGALQQRLLTKRRQEASVLLP